MLSRDGQWWRCVYGRVSSSIPAGICEILDRGDPSRPYAQALAVQASKIDDVALTPSARLMRAEATNESFFELALRMSMMHKDYFLELYPPKRRARRSCR